MRSQHSERSAKRRTGNGRVPETARRRLQPTLLALEDAQLLSTFPVTNNADRRRQHDRHAALGHRPGQRRHQSQRHRVRAGFRRRPRSRCPGPARAEQHERCDHDLRWSGRGRGHRLRQQREPGVPGRLRCHGVDLGTDDHRRQQQWQWRRPRQLRHDHVDRLHRQRQLGAHRRRPVELRHDYADRLHRLRQFRRVRQGRRRSVQPRRHSHADQLHGQRQPRPQQSRPAWPQAMAFSR